MRLPMVSVAPPTVCECCAVANFVTCSHPNTRILVSGPLQRSWISQFCPGLHRRFRLRGIGSHPPGPVPEPIRLSHRCYLWRICMHSAIVGLDHVQRAFYRISWACYCDKRQLRCWFGPDSGSLDLQSRGIQARLSDRPLDKRSHALCRVCGIDSFAALVWTQEPSTPSRKF